MISIKTSKCPKWHWIVSMSSDGSITGAMSMSLFTDHLHSSEQMPIFLICICYSFMIIMRLDDSIKTTQMKLTKLTFGQNLISVALSVCDSFGKAELSFVKCTKSIASSASRFASHLVPIQFEEENDISWQSVGLWFINFEMLLC